MNKLLRVASSAQCGLRQTLRQLHISPPLASVFGPGVWADPTPDTEELKKPLTEDDPRRYLYIKPLKSDETPVFYRDPVLDKFIRIEMSGLWRKKRRHHQRREFIRYHVFEALEAIKRIQINARKQAKTEEERSEIIVDPYVIFHKALFNCRPVMKMLPVTRGGITYSVPWPIKEKEAEFRAMKFIKQSILDLSELASKGTHTFRGSLARELIAASKNEGMSVRAKQEHHKKCEANRAFTHYRR